MEWELAFERARYGLEAIRVNRNRLEEEMELGLNKTQATLFLRGLQKVLANQVSRTSSSSSSSSDLPEKNYVSLDIVVPTTTPPPPQRRRRRLFAAKIRNLLFPRRNSSADENNPDLPWLNRASNNSSLRRATSHSFKPLLVLAESPQDQYNPFILDREALEDYRGTTPTNNNDCASLRRLSYPIHPTFTKTKLRKLKLTLAKILALNSTTIEISTGACAWVYFERLVLKGFVNKQNRYQVFGACLFLAAKFLQEDSSVNVETIISDTLQTVSDRKISHKDITKCEFEVFVRLDFCLIIPWEKCVAHSAHLTRLMISACND